MLFPDLPPVRPQGRRVSAKGRELLRRAKQTGALYTRGAGEASSRRALERAALLTEAGPSPDGAVLAETP